MTRFEKWFIRRTLAKEFLQSPEHHKNLSKVFALIREVWEAEFTEDNAPTTDACLREAFEQTQYRA